MIRSYKLRAQILTDQLLNKSEAIAALKASRLNENAGIFFHLHAGIEKEYIPVMVIAKSIQEEVYCRAPSLIFNFVQGKCMVNKSAYFNNTYYHHEDYWRVQPNIESDCYALNATTAWCSLKREVIGYNQTFDPLIILKNYSAAHLLNKTQVETALPEICSSYTYITCDKFNATLQSPNASASVFCTITAFNCTKLMLQDQCNCTRNILFGDQRQYSDYQQLDYSDTEKCPRKGESVASGLICSNDTTPFW